METVKIRGLVRLSTWMFGIWGIAVFLKGFYDLLGGQPEANLYAPAPWMFVTRPQWLRYAAFEACYGTVCLLLAWTLMQYSLFLPETIRRKRLEPELDIFN